MNPQSYGKQGGQYGRGQGYGVNYTGRGGMGMNMNMYPQQNPYGQYQGGYYPEYDPNHMNPNLNRFGGGMGKMPYNVPYGGQHDNDHNMYRKGNENHSGHGNFRGEGGQKSRVHNDSKSSFDTTGDFNEVMNNLIEYCKDHSGSRMIQKRYETGTEDERNQIFDKIFPQILSLSKDVFGNYVIQKILDNNTQDQEKNNKIMKSLEGSIQELTLHMYGCRVIQKAIEVNHYFKVRLLINYS